MNKKFSFLVIGWLAGKVPAIFCLTLALFGVGNTLAQTNTWDGSSSTDWNTAANWSLNLIPLAAHDVVIPNAVAGANDNPVISANAVCSTLAITGGAAAVSLSINSGISLAVTNGVTIGAGTGGGDNIILSVGAGSLSATGITMAATGNDNRASSLTITTGTVTIAGSITMNDADVDRNIVSLSGAGTLNVTGGITGGNLTTVAGSTVNYNGGVQTVRAVTYNGNLTLSGSGAKTTTSVTVNGILSMEGTATANAVIAYGASATLQYNTTTNRTVSSNEWISPFNGTGGVIIQSTGIITLNAAKVLGNGAQVNVNLGATLATGNFALTFGGNFINAGTFTAGSSPITIAGNVVQSIAGFTTTGLVSSTKTGNTATLTGAVNGAALTINGVGGTLNLGAGLTHTFTGTWTRTNGTLNGGSSILRIGGSVSGAGGTFTANTGTVEWNAAGAQTVAGVAYNNLTLSGSGVKTLTGVTTIGSNFETGGTASTTAAAALTIGGSVTLGLNTTFTAGAFTHNVAGNWTNNGATFDNTGSTITLNGAAQIIGGSSSTNFNDLILSGSNTKTFSVATVTDAKLIILSGVIADLSTLNHFANSLRIGGVGQPVGTSGSTSSPAVNTNDTFFAATTGFITVLTTVPSEIYYSRATGNWNSTTTWSTVSFASAINTGGFPAAGDIVNIGGGNFTVTVNVNSVCASMSYEASASNSPTVSINSGISLDVSGAITIPTPANFSGDVNTLAVGAGILNAASIDFDVNTLAQNALTISSGTVTISGDVTGGVLVLSTITFTGSGGLLRLGGAFLAPGNVSFTPASGTVEYYGSAAQSVQNLTYNNLTFSGAGLKTAVGDLDINGAFTLGSGTSFAAGPYTHTVAGNWNNNGTTFDNTGSTISLDGPAQSIGGTNATTFNNLTLAGSNTKTFGHQTIMDGILSINNLVVANLGTITTHQARALMLNGSGQVSGTWGSVFSNATNETDTYFTAGTAGEVIITNRIYFSNQTGPWTTNTTWSTVTYAGGTNLGNFPVAGDIVNIGGGAFTITVDANAACASISYLGGTSDSHTVSINAGITLDVSGVIDIPNAANFSGDQNTLAVGSGTLNAGGIAFSTAFFADNPVLSISSGTVTISGDITESGTGSVDVTFSGAGLLRLRGAFLNSGNCDFTASTGTVEYSSTSEAQSIGDFTYYNLTLNNTFSSTGQLALVGNTTVSNILTMTSGRVNLNGSTITLTRSASGALVHNFSSTAGWMYGGSINRAFPTTLISMGVSPSVDGMLPIGTSANFRPFYFAKTAGAVGTLTMSHSDPGTTTTGLNIVDPSGGSNVILRNNSAWVSTVTGGAGSTFRIRYGGTGLGTVTNLGHLRAMRLNDIIQTHIGATGTLTEPFVERNNLTVANMSSTFYVGSTDGGSPLPIELLHFTARIKNDVVELSWSTASEIDNDFFTIERAFDVENFETIGAPIDGRGTTNEKSDYFTTDENPIYGRSYYRLKQTDFDGKFSYSDLQVVNYEGPRFSSLQVYPNPSDGNTLTIIVTGLKEQASVPVQIFNVQGQKVFDRVLDVSTPGTLRYDAEFGTPLRQGLYIVKAGETLQLTRKIIVD